MKVLYFHQHFTTPDIGGGTRSYEFAKKLIERGHKVSVVCGETAKFNLPKTKFNGIYRGEVDGIDVIQVNLPYSNSDSIGKRTFIFIKFAFKGVRIALTEKYDLLFATSTPLTAGIPGIWVKWFGKTKRKFVFEVRDLWPELPKALGMKNPFLLWGMKILEKQSYKRADACIGLSPGICEGIQKRLRKIKLIEMIPNGCDLELFHPKFKKTVKLQGISPTDKVAVFTGAHGVANGLDAVLDMALELKRKGRSDIKVVFIGNGKTKSSIQNRALREGLDNCLFFEPISKFELKDIIASADIGLMVLKNVPAFYYGTSPNKFFDYIASGLSVVNNYPGWLADMIRENNCGEAVIPEDPKAFSDAVIRLIDNPELRSEQGKNARKLAEKEFSREALSNKFVDFLERVYS